MDTASKANVERWLAGPYDPKTKEQIRYLLVENPNELIDAFYTNLSFGTGGMRGLVGVGSNRINLYTVMSATQALSNYLHKQFKNQKLSVLVGFDCRLHSRELAQAAAQVLSANDVEVFLTREMRPTPLLSYGCRLKNCQALIIITASHNPAEYNGYKVYWNDGAQIVHPHDKGIMDEDIRDMSQVKTNAVKRNIYEIGDEIDQSYLLNLSGQQFYPEVNRKHGKELKVVYTNLHGTGITLMPQALASWGFSNLLLVDDQVVADGVFKTVSSPNPEDPEALEMGIEVMQQQDADILIATDPDADRLAAVVMHRGKPNILTGNQLASLCLSHVCRALLMQNRLSQHAAFIKTIATTELMQAIARSYGCHCFDVLPGFKYIAEQIRMWEEMESNHEFVFGAEESFGFLLGAAVRDKDGIQAGALICEIALQAKLQGKTLVDLLHELFAMHGVHVEKVMSLKFPDSRSGKEEMVEKMEMLRRRVPEEVAGVPVRVYEDYAHSIRVDCTTKEEEKLTLGKSNILLLKLDDETKLIIRPSGTEPKIKLYCGVVNRAGGNIKDALIEAEKRCDRYLQALSTFF